LFEEKPRLRHIKGEVIQELGIPVKSLLSIKQGTDYTSDNGTFYTNETLTTDPLPPRSYAFISDTAKKPGIIPIINGVDLLYHEATFSDEGKKRAKETGHSTSRQAAEIAQAAGVKKLILGHFSHRYKTLDGLLNEAKEVFPNTELVYDGAVYHIPDKK
jgi:ribonuclease Z